MATKHESVPVKREEAASPLARWTPFGEFRREFDRLFDSFFGRTEAGPFGRRMFDLEPLRPFEVSFGDLAPSVDVSEGEAEWTVKADLPGMDEKNVEVTLSNDVLTIKGEKKEEREENDKNYYLAERRQGAFQRSFRLPEGVDQEKIGASFEKGVLTVALPKSPEVKAKTKKITVKAG